MRNINAIEVLNLKKTFGDFTAVDSISFSVKVGELFGFVGPNGAGKTTTINMLTTLLAPTSGEARVGGFDIAANQDKVRASIGIIFQEPSLDGDLTAFENLWFHAKLYGVPNAIFSKRTQELLKMVEMEEWRDKIVKSFSGGMKRRLEIARGLIHHPKILFLDEPTLGLDPQTRAHIWQYLKNFRERENVTIFMTTHYLPETENCDDVVIINKGTIAAFGSPSELKKRFKQNSMDGVFLEATGHNIRDEKLSKEDQAVVNYKQGGGWRR